MRNHEVTQRHQLLDLNGRLMEPGWSKDLVQVYDRRAIKAPKFRIKEWDCRVRMCRNIAHWM